MTTERRRWRDHGIPERARDCRRASADGNSQGILQLTAAAATTIALAAGVILGEYIAQPLKTLFRTAVTGFGTRADATAFCDQLKAAGKTCFVR